MRIRKHYIDNLQKLEVNRSNIKWALSTLGLTYSPVLLLFFFIDWSCQSSDIGHIVLTAGLCGALAFTGSILLTKHFYEQSTSSLGEYIECKERLNAELHEFSRIASHDLKAPLRGLKNLKKWYLSETDPIKKAEYSDRMDQNIDKLGHLIQDLSQYTQIGIDPCNDEVVDTRKSLQEAIDIAKDFAPKEFHFDLGTGFPRINATKKKLESAFKNLVENAVKYRSKDSGHLKVEFKKDEHSLIFLFSDDGIGIPESFFPNAFKPFKRYCDNELIAGTGMGLALVKKIAEIHGGSVHVRSTVGEGSTFFLKLPISRLAFS